MTIKERATKYAIEVSPYPQDKGATYDTATREAYIKGATEQRAIDTDKASHWLLENMDFGTPAYREQFVKDFIEAMKED